MGYEALSPGFSGDSLISVSLAFDSGVEGERLKLARNQLAK
jgi:hypothetical protein